MGAEVGTSLRVCACVRKGAQWGLVTPPSAAVGCGPGRGKPSFPVEVPVPLKIGPPAWWWWEVGIGCPCNEGRGGNRAGRCLDLRASRWWGALFSSLLFLNPSLDSLGLLPKTATGPGSPPQRHRVYLELQFLQALVARKGCSSEVGLSTHQCGPVHMVVECGSVK